MDKLPSSHFNSDDYRKEERLKYFRHMTSSVYDVEATTAESDIFVKTSGYQVGQLMFHTFKSDGLRFRRNENHIVGNNRDFLVLQAQLSGEELLQTENGFIRLLPNKIYLRDWAYPFDSEARDIDIMGVVIPRHLLHAGITFSSKNSILIWDVSSSQGTVLLNLWKNIFEQLPLINVANAQLLGKGFIGYLNGICETATFNENDPIPKFQTIELYLRTQLRNNIETNSLAQKFHLSRSTIYRLFKPHGGIQHFIEKLKLEQCYSELSNRDPNKTTIGEIAASWGYTDARTFNRKFHKEFGIPPSKVSCKAAIGNQANSQNKEQALPQDNKYKNFKNWLTTASNR